MGALPAHGVLVGEAYRLFEQFSAISIKTVLIHGDLLSSGVDQRHHGALLSIARTIWPRWFIRLCFPKAGLFMLIEVRK
ncbi:MAG: hypothetical protein K8F29_09510 [Kofleriaceae bacterium]|nr:hypothetical protein [Candidatus Methylomirabilis lanthanidiphila]